MRNVNAAVSRGKPQKFPHLKFSVMVDKQVLCARSKALIRRQLIKFGSVDVTWKSVPTEFVINEIVNSSRKWMRIIPKSKYKKICSKEQKVFTPVAVTQSTSSWVWLRRNFPILWQTKSVSHWKINNQNKALCFVTRIFWRKIPRTMRPLVNIFIHFSSGFMLSIKHTQNIQSPFRHYATNYFSFFWPRAKLSFAIEITVITFAIAIRFWWCVWTRTWIICRESNSTEISMRFSFRLRNKSIFQPFFWFKFVMCALRIR